MIRWVFNIGSIREFLGRTCGPRIAESVPKALRAARKEAGTLSRCARAVLLSRVQSMGGGFVKPGFLCFGRMADFESLRSPQP